MLQSIGHNPGPHLEAAEPSTKANCPAYRHCRVLAQQELDRERHGRMDVRYMEGGNRNGTAGVVGQVGQAITVVEWDGRSVRAGDTGGEKRICWSTGSL